MNRNRKLFITVNPRYVRANDFCCCSWCCNCNQFKDSNVILDFAFFSSPVLFNWKDFWLNIACTYYILHSFVQFTNFDCVLIFSMFYISLSYFPLLSHATSFNLPVLFFLQFFVPFLDFCVYPARLNGLLWVISIVSVLLRFSFVFVGLFCCCFTFLSLYSSPVSKVSSFFAKRVFLLFEWCHFFRFVLC